MNVNKLQLVIQFYYKIFNGINYYSILRNNILTSSLSYITNRNGL